MRIKKAEREKTKTTKKGHSEQVSSVVAQETQATNVTTKTQTRGNKSQKEKKGIDNGES